MRELVRDKGHLEDIVEYSANVIKIIENVEFEELFFKYTNLFLYHEECGDCRRGGLYAYQGIQSQPPGDSMEIGGRYAPCSGSWLFAGVASYSLGNSQGKYS